MWPATNKSTATRKLSGDEVGFSVPANSAHYNTALATRYVRDADGKI
jgi:hypothetical protein